MAQNCQSNANYGSGNWYATSSAHAMDAMVPCETICKERRMQWICRKVVVQSLSGMSKPFDNQPCSSGILAQVLALYPEHVGWPDAPEHPADNKSTVLAYYIGCQHVRDDHRRSSISDS